MTTEHRDDDALAEGVSGVAALAEPTRRALFRYVTAQREPVGRDQAAEAVGVPRHTARFHLDKLVEHGLLDIQYRRLSGRTGPGAGRPAKVYTRSARQLTVTIPERRYDLAARLMAQAIAVSQRQGTPVVEALHDVAADLGAALGEDARARLAEPPWGGGPSWGEDPGGDPARADGPEPGMARAGTMAGGDVVAATCHALERCGYEPRRQPGYVSLANCPFDALAHEHTELVCGMNLALLGALTERVSGGALTARLDPTVDRCCVVLDEAPPERDGRHPEQRR